MQFRESDSESRALLTIKVGHATAHVRAKHHAWRCGAVQSFNLPAPQPHTCSQKRTVRRQHT
eukprot:353440-Chlamydomonas_euryale.AAC.5